MPKDDSEFRLQQTTRCAWRLESIETAVRGMEEELLAHEAPKTQQDGHRRRTYLVEELRTMKSLLADDDVCSRSWRL